jgi:hypothetical protein
MLMAMKTLAFAAVNGKSCLPVAAAPRRNLLIVPVWDLRAAGGAAPLQHWI